MLRSVSLFALVGAAISAQAVDAYSNIPAGNYAPLGNVVTPFQTLGYQFTSGATGALTGFQIAMNNNDGTTGAAAFTLDLYADGGGTLGALLGSYGGLSTGINFAAATNQLSSVAASGVGLTSGTSYWLIARSSNDLVWSWTDGSTTQNTAYNTGGPFLYSSFNQGAFSVQVAAVPGPAALAPFALGLVGTMRKRRKSA